MKKIYWTIPTSLDQPGLNLAYFEPEPAYKYLIGKKANANYIRCPAFSAYLKNTYILRSPIDFKIWFFDGEFHTDSCDQKFYDKNIWCKVGISGEHLVQMPPTILFFTKDNKTVTAESLPPVMHEVPNALFIPGSFDISKWVRPLNFAFEISDVKKAVNIKRGDPLYMVKFICEDGDSVELERVLMDEDLRQVIATCTGLKHIAPKINLKTLYGMAENYLKLARANIFKK